MGAAALLLAAACEDRGGADRRAAGTGSSAARTEPGAPGAQAGAQSTVTGQVVSAKKDELVLKQAGQDKDLKLKVDEKTQVMIDGRQSTIDNVREGTQVRASYDASQKATRIEAMGGAAGGGQADRPGGSAGTTGGLGGSSSSTPGQTGGPGGGSSTSAGQPPAGSSGSSGSR
jgi:hypothetical protein